MPRIETYTLGPLQTNAYLLVDEEDKRAVVIDPGTADADLLKRIQYMEVEAVLLTHAHFDHIGGVQAIRNRKHCPVYLHAAEWSWFGDAEKNGSARWADVVNPITLDPPDRELRNGQKLKLLDEEYQVRHTPGHSPGSVSLIGESGVFGGDVLFRQGIGRTDLNGGSTKELYRSIYEVLFKLPEDTTVYPGHGPVTTIGHEMRNNPYV